MMKNIGQMMKQAQQVQANLKKVQDEIQQTLVEGSSGNGLVTITLGGDKMVKKVSINEGLMKEDKAMLEDLIQLAMNEASEKLESLSQSKMSAVTAGFPMPPGLKF